MDHDFSPTGFDEAALHAWLSQHLAGYAGPLQVAKFAGGQSNPTYRLGTPGATYVMRAKPGPAAKLLPSAHAVEREFAVMQALHGSGVPVPRMRWRCATTSRSSGACSSSWNTSKAACCGTRHCRA